MSLQSCENREVIVEIPKPFKGKWKEILPANYPESEATLIKIASDKLKISEPDIDNNRNEETYDIKKIEKESDNKIVIFCKIGLLDSEVTLILKNSVLHISEYVYSGVTDADRGRLGAHFDIGKYHK